MTTALNYYKKHSMDVLVKIAKSIEDDPANQVPPEKRVIFLYTIAARKKLKEISQAIAWHIEDSRKAAGRPVPVCGYSGRLTKRNR